LVESKLFNGDDMTGAAKVSRSPELHGGQILRRYLDLAKYLDLLKTSHLRLNRGDLFDDKFEGALTPALRVLIDQAHRTGSSVASAEDFYSQGRKGSYVSSWTLSDRCNMALWKLYGGASTSVAVTTTVEQLCRAAISWNTDVFLWRVRYVDHWGDPDFAIEQPVRLMEWKPQAYEFENEVRVIVPRDGPGWQQNSEFVAFPVDVARLVNTVVVAPEAKDWFFELVTHATRDLFKLPCEVVRSKLAYVP
jgi:hypothetical protein